MKIENWMLGTDIEFFTLDQNINEIISAEGLIRGSKYEPFHFDPVNKGFATSLDCVLAEGNIPPVKSKMEWINNITRLRQYIDSMLPQGICTVALPAVYMNEKWLQSDTAKRFGCEPAYIVYGQLIKENPDNNTSLRSAGLHVHVSFDERDEQEQISEELVKSMDLFLSVPAVLSEAPSDRKKLYGQAGEFRFGEQKYNGIEYRSLSSFWAETDRRLAWVYDNTLNAIKYVNEAYAIDQAVEELIQVAVNQNNKEVAQELVNKFNVPVFA